MYEGYERGVKLDYAEAYFWLSLAVKSSKAPESTAEKRDEAANNLTPEQIAAIDKRVKKWKPSPAPSKNQKTPP